MALLLLLLLPKMKMSFLLLSKRKMVFLVLLKTKMALLLQPKTKMAILLLLDPVYIHKTCRFFRSRLQKVIAVGGEHIDK